MFTNIMEKLFGKTVYTKQQLEEVENEIRYFYEKMLNAKSYKQEMECKEVLENLDAKYKKMKFQLGNA
jgi:CRISPR/Cas system CSM-associated protein Csm2 small subunit